MPILLLLGKPMYSNLLRNCGYAESQLVTGRTKYRSSHGDMD